MEIPNFYLVTDPQMVTSAFTGKRSFQGRAVTEFRGMDPPATARQTYEIDLNPRSFLSDGNSTARF